MYSHKVIYMQYYIIISMKDMYQYLSIQYFIAQKSYQIMTLYNSMRNTKRIYIIYTTMDQTIFFVYTKNKNVVLLTRNSSLIKPPICIY